MGVPPHILGGLGTASYGLTEGMSQQGRYGNYFLYSKAMGAMKIRASYASLA